MNEQQTTGRARPGPTGLPPFAAAGWRDGAEFLRGFLRNPAQVGSVIPSSPQLEQRLVRNAGIADARCAVELGPGTGGTTAALLRALPAQGRLLAIELDPQFHRHVAGTLQDARLALELGSAERIEEFLVAHGMERPDAIVSGIPFSTMPAEVSQRIAAVIARVLRPGGRFVAYQVRPHVERFLTPELGAPLQREWELLNVPPVRVFTWVKR
ncbi:MAG TPA: methyltransferase domain-containing protein [Ramlibacter sp.]|jgi:phospholipid N-methyltransferase|nr:methyltransferase domain-containing protein [Ramlibacter sp.]